MAVQSTHPSASWAGFDPAIFRRTAHILARTAHAFFADNVSRLGAALAFYTTLAVAPLLVLSMAVAGMVFEENEARARVIWEIQSLAGSPATEVIKTVQNPVATSTGTVATLVGAVTLVFGVLGVFHHLQAALNSIWRVPASRTLGWIELLREKLFSLATVMMTGFLLLVSLIASAALSWVGSQTVSRLGLPVLTLQVLNNVISFCLITLLFALIFKLLPDTPIRWKHVWLGAAVTALLFTLGKTVLGFYLGRAGVTSAYGAAGSLVALLLWCYYAAQIVFLGVEFTRITAISNGGRDFSLLSAPTQRKRTP